MPVFHLRALALFAAGALAISGAALAQSAAKKTAPAARSEAKVPDVKAEPQPSILTFDNWRLG